MLKGVGPKVAERLERLAIEQVQDLFFHLPLRYEDRTRVVPIGSLRPGMQVVIEGEVDLAEVVFRRRRTLLVRMSDGTGAITLRFFHFSAAQKAQLERGALLRCFGEVRPGASRLELIHPEYSRIDSFDAATDAHLTAVYPVTEGVHQLTLRKLIAQALDKLERGEALREWLPDPLLEQLQLPTLAEAILYVHRPPEEAPLDQLVDGEHPSQQRLVFEELLAHHLSLRKLREEAQRQPAPTLQAADQLRRKLLTSLPFELTAAQRRVVGEIDRDIEAEAPMLRLVQGDVGSGKTVVAALAILRAVEAGFQAAIMAPTELLAEQHLQNFSAWLEPLGIEVAWLSGRSKGRVRSEALARIGAGHARVVVGTHALFQDDVLFDHLGLLVIDEQHRFGVHQRFALREKGIKAGRHPHQLIMTATPIPRTLAMSLYADLDVSIIDELPPGRTPVKTVVLSDTRRDEVVARVSEACSNGRQAYWVCTLIEESELLEAQAAEATASEMAEMLPGLRIGLVHGRMKSVEKERVMAAFKAAEIDLLVATTVIEVGVDVPNASLMIIENAERLGLSQLHQLRGRVGRGSAESSCVLLYHGTLGQTAKRRLMVMRESNDGFVISRHDLEIRGPGEVLGTRQTGEMSFRIADLMRDQVLLPEVERASMALLADYPEHVTPLIRRWLGEGSRYGEV